MRTIQSQLMDLNHPALDHATLHWHRSLDGLMDEFFGHEHAKLLEQIRWQVQNIMTWLPTWMVYVSTLCWEEWGHLEVELQRLYMLLDYEHPPNWFSKILSNPKYTTWVAKLVVFCLRQHQQQQGGSNEEPTL